MKCDFCGTTFKLIDFGSSPIAGYKVKTIDESLNQPIFPLIMMFCPHCNYTRYNEYLGMDKILNKMYEEQETTYSFSNKVSNYIDNLTSELINEYSLSTKSSIMEIGCNDGSLLYCFKNKLNCNLIGIEPSKHFRESWGFKKLYIINDYFNSKTIETIDFQPDIIIIRHVLEHILNVKKIFEDFSKIMNDTSILVIEVPYLQTIIKNKRVENISHPHRNYFTIRSLNEVISKFNLGISKYKLVNTDGGSIVLHIRKNIKTDKAILDSLNEEDLISLKKYISRRKSLVDDTLYNYSLGEVVGYGAGAKGPHLIYLFGLDKYINTVFDIQKNYEGKYIPGTKIKIKQEDFNDNNIKAVIILAPTHIDEIKASIPDYLDIINIIEE